MSMSLVDLKTLLGLFPETSVGVGVFQEAEAEELPDSFRKLLVHDDHMTLAVESFHGCSVKVEVIRSRMDGNAYIREILLRRETDDEVVQYGIVRLQLDVLAPATREEILAEKVPLGRVLIEHGVLRQVELVGLWRIEIGPRLGHFFSLPPGTVTYGRTAMIHFGVHSALELLEIVRVV
jgi:chorismate-pyruvate lyase